MLLATVVVIPTSRVNQSICSSVVEEDLGGMMCVIYPLLSLSNASFLNPSETKDNWPKLELELVIEASEPLFASKCLL